MRRAVAVLASMAAFGCGERAAERPADAARAPVTARRPPDSAGAEVPASARPAELAAACVAGDPAEGTPRRLDGIDGELLEPVPIEALASRDSARLAARIAHAVDILPSDTSRADFRGLPVVVRAAWLVRPADRDTLVVALVARRLPMESSPLEEVFFVVAAPGARQGMRDPLLPGWVVREVGTEEEVPMRELVAAFAAPGGLTIAAVHDAPDATIVELVERRPDGWGRGWSGVLPACAVP